MRIVGKLIKGTMLLKEEAYEIDDLEGSYQHRLEKCLVEICGKLHIEVPLWFSKNTREYVRFRRTSFNEDQFFNPVLFDRFEIRIE